LTLQLSHPDLDLLIIVLTVAPCIYFGLAEGIRRAMQRPKKIRPATHPFRRDGDKYAYYFYVVYKYVGPDSVIGRIPKLGAVPTGLLAAYALKLVVTKGEQYEYDRQKKVSRV
jgi:hypothetical protein